MTQAAAKTQEFKFVIHRTFDAPRELVWKAWTTEKQLLQWFSPKGMPMTQCKLDFRPGGTLHYAMQLPNDGGLMWGKWEFIEISKPEKLVFMTMFSDENAGLGRHPLAPDWPQKMHSTVTFTEKNGKTTVTVEWFAHHPTDIERKTFIEGASSMNQGWTGTFDQLEKFLAQQ